MHQHRCMLLVGADSKNRCTSSPWARQLPRRSGSPGSRFRIFPNSGIAFRFLHRRRVICFEDYLSPASGSPKSRFCSRLRFPPKLNRGVIERTLSDPQGAIVPGVDVTITNTETKISVALKSNSAGLSGC
jgi:hypothetical protein